MKLFNFSVWILCIVLFVSVIILAGQQSNLKREMFVKDLRIVYLTNIITYLNSAEDNKIKWDIDI